MRTFSKLLLVLVCMGVSLAFSTTASAACGCHVKENTEFKHCKKTYISPQQIAFDQNKIMVNINDFIVQTCALHSDAEGVYFVRYRNDEACTPPDWECENSDCKACNPCWMARCSECLEWR